MEVGNPLSIDDMASKPKKVEGWLYMLMTSISVLLVWMVQADMSLDGLWMGLIDGAVLVLMYRHERGRDCSFRLVGWHTTKCHPGWLLGRLVRECIGGS